MSVEFDMQTISMNNSSIVQEPCDTFTHFDPDVLGVNETTSSIEHLPNVNAEKIIAVIGSGDYGRAISGRLVKSGYTVYIGSRDPNKGSTNDLVRQTGASLVSQEAAIASAKVIIVAVGKEYYNSLPLSSLTSKILIDVSNNTKKQKGPQCKSNAEQLQALIPESNVVKSFNVVSAYSLENGGLQGSKEVYLASDDVASKAIVSDIVRAMGFTPVDYGTLRASRDIEDIPLRLMPSWRKPMTLVFGMFLFLYSISVLSGQICTNAETGNWDENWKNLSLINFNRTLAICALWTLSLCYLPGVLAGYIQLYRGTKYSRFPNWMDNWLKMRKQLGLLMFAMACVHGCISVAYVNPQNGEWIYETPRQIMALVRAADGSTKEEAVNIYNLELNWRGELFLTLGAIALCFTAILGISSLPSVTASLTWREFSFIQSKIGWSTLIIASFHVAFFGWKFMFKYFSCFNSLPYGPQYALYGPFLTICLKLPLLWPSVDKYLNKIRNGYERPSNKPRVNQNQIA